MIMKNWKTVAICSPIRIEISDLELRMKSMIITLKTITTMILIVCENREVSLAGTATNWSKRNTMLKVTTIRRMKIKKNFFKELIRFTNSHTFIKHSYVRSYFGFFNLQV